jgi:hypothetical protein
LDEAYESEALDAEIAAVTEDLVDGIDVWGVRTLRQLQNWLNGSSGLDDRIAAAGTDSVPTRA